jgi:diguanylate cyclase (GGDEF)-like protein
MVTTALRRQAGVRLALTGLVVGFVVLAAVGVLASVAIHRAVRTVDTADRAIAVWYSTFGVVSQELEAMNEYLRAPDPIRLREVQVKVGSAEPSVRWLEDQAAGTMVERVALVRREYGAMTGHLGDLVAAGLRGDRETVLAYGAKASYSGTALRKLLTSAIHDQRQELRAELVQVEQDNVRLRTAGHVVIAVDAILLMICAMLLLSYRHRVERLAADGQRQARHDVLTGLGNRMMLEEQLVGHVRHSEATGERVALLLLDLDGFKAINDTLGHSVGDLLLQQVGNRLAAAVRKTDVVTRLGGDEFAVIMPGVPSAEAAAAIAAEILDELQQPADLAGTVVDVTGSVGLALSPDHSQDSRELLQFADIAMYAAKRERLGVAVYERPADRTDATQLALLGQLRRAIDEDELILHYQPKIDARTHAVSGVEALVRWQHPQRGLLGPGVFVPLAEHSGLMARLTDHVIGLALKQASQWRAAGRDLPVAVNVGARCVLDLGFPDAVARRLAETGLPAETLTLEITETGLIGDPQRATQILRRLRSLGVRLSLDDFGTGYSSMTHLSTLPVHEIKIDRSFVGSMHTDGNRRVIVRATITLARSLGLDVVAEGIEDDRAWTDLIAMQCTTGQGYHLGRPMPAEDLLAWLTARADALIG